MDALRCVDPVRFEAFGADKSDGIATGGTPVLASSAQCPLGGFLAETSTARDALRREHLSVIDRAEELRSMLFAVVLLPLGGHHA